jgi:uncharacterized metal-binding protein
MELTICSKTKKELIDLYANLDDETMKMLEASYGVVKETKASADRLEEIRLFAKKMGYKRIGIAFCKALRKIGRQVDAELSKDFEVFSVCCDCCGLTREEISMPYLKAPSDAACNSIGQATALNDKEVELTIACGFCLGHDIIFAKHIKSPVTHLLNKDRKYGHKTIERFKDG